MQRRHPGHKSRTGGRNGECGGEFWASRPGGTDPGKKTKIRTHRIERRTSRRLSIEEIGELGDIDDPRLNSSL